MTWIGRKIDGWLNDAMIYNIARHVVGGLCLWLVARGYIDKETAGIVTDPAVEALVALIGFALVLARSFANTKKLKSQQIVVKR